jgi:hypothetical protein
MSVLLSCSARQRTKYLMAAAFVVAFLFAWHFGISTSSHTINLALSLISLCGVGYIAAGAFRVKPMAIGAFVGAVMSTMVLFTALSLTLNVLNPDPPPIRIPSPDGKTFVDKQYSKRDFAGFANVYLVTTWWFWEHAHNLSMASNNLDKGGWDGATVSWDGNRRLVVGWPDGRHPMHGPSRVDGIFVEYRAYDPILSNVDPKNVENLLLQLVAVTFLGQETNRSDTACILKVTGVDAIKSSKVMIEFGSVGAPGPVILKVRVGLNTDDSIRRQTLNQAELANVVPRVNFAPIQGLGSIQYSFFSLDEAQKILSTLAQGRVDLSVGWNFGTKVIHYTGATTVSRDVIEKFNLCSSRGHVFGESLVMSSAGAALGH